MAPYLTGRTLPMAGTRIQRAIGKQFAFADQTYASSFRVTRPRPVVSTRNSLTRFAVQVASR